MPSVGEFRIVWHGDAVTKNVAGKLERIVKSACEAVKAEAIRSIRDDPKTGKWYWGRSGRYYQASAASESPAVDTGSLMRSISVLMEKEGTSITAYIGLMDPSKHDPLYKPMVSWYLEKGHYNKKAGRNIPPRPFMNPALMKVKKKIDDIISKESKI